MEDLIFIVLFVAVPTILLTMGFIAVLTREKQEMKKNGGPTSSTTPRQ